VREKERQRKTERETERERDGERARERDRERETERERQRKRDGERETEGERQRDNLLKFQRQYREMLYTSNRDDVRENEMLYKRERCCMCEEHCVACVKNTVLYVWKTLHCI